MRMSAKGKPALTRDERVVQAWTYSLVVDELLSVRDGDGFDPECESGERLLALLDKIQLLADWSLEKARAVKAGRPPKSEKVTQGGLLQVLTDQAARKPGRPNKWPADFELVVYRIVEVERQRLRNTRKSKPTITAAIESLLRDKVAPAMGQTQTTAVAMHSESMRSLYKRGRERSKLE